LCTFSSPSLRNLCRRDKVARRRQGGWPWQAACRWIGGTGAQPGGKALRGRDPALRPLPRPPALAAVRAWTHVRAGPSMGMKQCITRATATALVRSAAAASNGSRAASSREIEGIDVHNAPDSVAQVEAQLEDVRECLHVRNAEGRVLVGADAVAFSKKKQVPHMRSGRQRGVRGDDFRDGSAPSSPVERLLGPLVLGSCRASAA
jgi:hypothetical protein